jgi:hypothetical protein
MTRRELHWVKYGDGDFQHFSFGQVRRLLAFGAEAMGVLALAPAVFQWREIVARYGEAGPGAPSKWPAEPKDPHPCSANQGRKSPRTTPPSIRCSAPRIFA